MLGIIVCTHAGFAEGIRESVEMITGAQENFDVLCFQNGEDMIELSDKIKEIARRYDAKKIPFVILVDLFGATPFNASAIGLAAFDSKIITGVNLPVLLELVTGRESFENLDLFLQNALASAKDSMKIVNIKDMFNS